jgi:hypothetical protein
MNIARIKLGAAAVLLACLALPEYTCSKYVGPDGKAVSAGPEGVPATPYREIQEKHYPLEAFSASDVGSWLILLTYVWPWPVLAYSLRKRGNGALGRVVWLAELLLAMGSGYVVWASSSVGTRAAGAYFAMAADAVYLGAWVSELRKKWPWRKVSDRLATGEVS